MPPRERDTSLFTGISFRRKEIAGLGVHKYRIYSDDAHYVLIEAENAQAALEASGVKNPLRVLHDSIYLDNIMKPDDTPRVPPPTETEILAPTVQDEPKETQETQQPDAPSADISTAANPALSSDDVDKLLNN